MESPKKHEVSKEVYEQAEEDNRTHERKIHYLDPDTDEEVGTLGWDKAHLVREYIATASQWDLERIFDNSYVDKYREKYPDSPEPAERAFENARQKRENRYYVYNLAELEKDDLLKNAAEQISLDEEMLRDLAEANCTFQELLEKME